jgi:hypothetical protein
LKLGIFLVSTFFISFFLVKILALHGIHSLHTYFVGAVQTPESLHSAQTSSECRHDGLLGPGRQKSSDQPFQHEFTLPVSPNLAKMGRKGWFRFDLKG